MGPESVLVYCRVCAGSDLRLLLDLSGTPGVNSLGELVDEGVKVWLCATCGQASKVLPSDIVDYYANDYTISVSSDDDDQVYAVRDGEVVYRTEHQARVIEKVVPLPSAANVLDFGCAKGSTSRWLLRRRPDLCVHLFDVTRMHAERWQELVPVERTAVDHVPHEWSGRMDLVFTMFTLEHMSDPAGSVGTMRNLLKDGGFLHAVVPNPVVNRADLIVSDHVNHFTRRSLVRMLDSLGFTGISVDDEVHEAALTVTARKQSDAPNGPEPPDESGHIVEIAETWARFRDRVRAFEDGHFGKKCAVFGAGVNGAFVYSCLRGRASVVGFVDNNPHLQGTERLGVPVMAPSDLPPEVAVLYSGLSPRLARSVIDSSLAGRAFDAVFL